MSTIPAVLDALVAALRLNPDLDGVQVLDGEPFVDLDPDVLVIGFSPDRSAVEQTETPAGLEADQESYNIAGLVSSWSGEPELKARRDRVFELVAAVRDELRRDQTLGGVCLRAHLSVSSLSQAQTFNDGAWTGAQATIEFVISVRAFL